MNRTVLGIDFGSSTLKLALWDGSQVVKLMEEPMPEQLVRNGNVVSAEAMASFLKSTLKQNRISARKAAVVLPSTQVFLQRSELPPMTEAQLKLNLPYEFRDFISEEKDRYFYDYAVIDLVKNEAGQVVKMNLLAAAAPKALIAEYEDICRWAGLKLITAIPAEVAYGTLLRRFEAVHPEVAGDQRCIVDYGHSGCRVYFYGGDSFETLREGERGGAAIDDLLSELLGVDVHIARAYKESNQQGELDRPEVQNIMQDLAREVQRTVNFYSYNNPDRELRHVWICGGGSRIPYLINETRELLGLELHSMHQLVECTAEPTVVNTCAAAIGAAMQ